MRLIDTQTFELQEFPQNRTPEYAILSHTWEDGEEVLYSDFPSLLTKQRRGWRKIANCCKQAIKDGIRYVWIDTCCIDKASSAELSEAINSMFSWYRKAIVCYAYLYDVPSQVKLQSVSGQALVQSRWFTRGWTLQELLAPARVEFFSQDWDSLGSKDSLRTKLKSITGIPIEILTGRREVESASIAQRMSWASSRETTRVEDLAYSLMGIFGVNMPMLYGEGEKAFLRLQEEIMKTSDDQSLFAWKNPEDSQNKLRGLLADHPKYFRHSGKFVARPELDDENIPISSTGKGIWINTYIDIEDGDNATALLKCTEGNEANAFAALRLTRFGPAKSHFARVDSHKLERRTLGGVQRPFYVHQDPKHNIGTAMKPRYLWLSFLPGAFHVTVDKILPERNCDVKPFNPYTNCAQVTAGIPSKVFFREDFGESKSESEIGDSISHTTYLNGRPSDYIFSLPLRPSTKFLSFTLESNFKRFLISVGLDRKGQIGWAVTQKGMDDYSQDIGNAFVPEQFPANSMFQVNQEWFQILLTAPNLDRLAVDQVAILQVQIVNCQLAGNHGRYSTMQPNYPQQESGVVETGRHGLHMGLGSITKKDIISVVTAGLVKHT